jgi:probable F420-dependent oxidoreductase
MSRPFRFGIVSASAQSGAEWVARARRIEELGYATLLVVDRTLVGLAPWTALAMAAGATTTLRVGSHVFCNDYRHPALLAKEAATLDLLSNGRFELGLGAGVGPMDYQQLGIPFASAGTRVSRVEEALHIIKQLWSGEVVNFSGQHYTITGMCGLPRPLQQPYPPIFIGSAGKRMLSLAAREATIVSPTLKGWPVQDPTDVPLAEKIAWVREAAGERFSQLELAQGAYPITITDSAAEVMPQVGGPQSAKTPMSTEQAIEHLLEQRERYGFSYLQLHEGQMENFAPVVARLAGK